MRLSLEQIHRAQVAILFSPYRSIYHYLTTDVSD